MMKRMEDLEAREAAGEGAKDQEEEEEESTEAQAAAPKAKGNDAFSPRCFQASNQYYSQAIELATSQILNGNRAAAYHRLKKFKLALEDSDVARRSQPQCVYWELIRLHSSSLGTRAFRPLITPVKL
ncbi:hypothetical protein PF005_g26005 [Phytophthora fragariae]|uniref:Uncharacterized protein n=1 Tax=Phytophthora fragariae TaxID=53985 RepID=A0A6A3R5B7_9STRA|nr:hypothetical protein PF003_g39263 [Phytophthora fragariae]KAE8927307.1 hypothetical protein PF009_g22525 [Phytophthora fragariae]KAE9089696.1 hypothetical protein PF006_g25302 [Phytophthora fragariae]KAE9174087.1 hypothetical protein PF005_g26005 [Phytophthora fragariae]KAE9183283.1 hypothetical protein PF002_g26752 [Phytophthora fragariae]